MRRFRSTFILAACLACVALSSEAHADWSDGGSMPTARAQAGIAVDQSGAIHVIGGYITSSNEVTNHDVLYADGGWAALAPLPKAIRAAAAATGPDGVIYFVGGFASSGGELSTAFAFGLDGGWTTLPNALVPDASTGATPGWETAGDFGADGKLYIFGGEGEELSDSGALAGGTNSRTMIYDPGAKTWTQGAPMPARRMQHRALRGSDGNFYIIGGEGSSGGGGTDTVFVYNPSANTWTNGPPLFGTNDAGADAGPVPVNSFAAAASPDRSHLYVAGGSNAYGNGSSPFFANVYVFDVNAQTWSTLPTPLPMGRRELVGAFDPMCKLHVLGGSTGSPVTEHDVQLLCVPSIDGGVLDAGADAGMDAGADAGMGDGGPMDASMNDATLGDGSSGSDGSSGDDGSTTGDSGGGPGGNDATTGGSDSGESDAGPAGTGDSGGCGCAIVGSDSSEGTAALVGLGVVAAAVVRTRRRRARK